MASPNRANGGILRAVAGSTLANEAASPEYYHAAERLWQDVTERKLYLTGGVGSINQYEGFSFGYYLPIQ